MVPDVWSYPSCFKTSNANRKTQVENSKPAQNDVFLDLSRAPPRCNETAISEETEEDNMVLEKTDRNQTDETTPRRESLNHEDLSTPHLQYEFEAGVPQTQEDGLLEIVMLDKEEELLDTASSFLKSSWKDNISVNDDMQSDAPIVGDIDAENSDLVASGKRHHIFEENLTRKSVKTAPAGHTDDNQDDVISELILAEENWQEEEAGTVLAEERKEHIEDTSSFSTWATHESASSAVVVMKSEETCSQVDDNVDKQNFLELVMPGPVQRSTKIDHSSQAERMVVENNDILASLPSDGHSRVTADVNRNFVINSPITKTGPVTDESEYTEPVVFEADGNRHFGLSVELDPLIDTEPVQDRSTAPSKMNLGLEDSNFDSEGVELIGALGHGATPEGLVEVEIDGEEPVTLNGIRSDGKGTDSPVAFYDSGESQSTSDSGSVRDGIGVDSSPVDLDNFADSVSSHMVCLEFDADSDTEPESTMSDEDESLWSTFPEYFHPGRRLRYSNNKQAELLLAEEDQDTDDLVSTKMDREVALVGVKELGAAYKSNCKDTVDVSEKQDSGSFTDDSEKLSTASSESFEYTYEVNAEVPSESEEVSEDSGYVNLRGQNVRRIEEICDQRKDTNSFSPHSVMVAQDNCVNDKCDIPLSTLSDPNDQIAEVNGPMVSSTAEITFLLDQENVSEKKECTEMSKDISQEQPARPSLESGHENESSCFFLDDPLKDDLLEERDGWRSSNSSDEDKGRILERDFSPSDWIIPSPPSPTPELHEAEICIVSPPSLSPTLIEDDLDAELKHLIVPPPPSSADTLPIVSRIKIVSPPPLEVNANELDHLLYDYDDVRFLSLTDDHKIATNNVLISARNSDSNFTEDRKIQAQKVKADAPSISKNEVDANKSVGMSSIGNNLFDLSGNSCNAVQDSVEQSSTMTAFTTRSVFSIPNPLKNCSVAMDGSATTWKRFHKEERISDDHLNKDNIRDKGIKPKKITELNSISNSGQGNHSKFLLRQKPPVPPKPRNLRAAIDDRRYFNVKSKNVIVKDSFDSCSKGDSESSRNTSFSKEKSSVKLEASRPTLLDADEQVTTGVSCGDSSVLDSQTTTGDITTRNEVNSAGEKHGTRRSSSFTCGSPYVPAPYMQSSSSQCPNSAESSVIRTHKFTPHTSRLLSEHVPTSAAFTLFSKNKPHISVNEASFSGQPFIESPTSQSSIVNPQEDNCNNSLTIPPLSDSPPPPLPESSPPKLIPEFDAVDFDFGELRLETFQDDTQYKSRESVTFGLPSSAKELKSKRSITTVSYKQRDSSGNFSERREKPRGGNTLCRSLTLTTYPPGINQRPSSVQWTSHRDAAFPDIRTKSSSFPFHECVNLKDVTATGMLSSLRESQSLKAKCLSVCEEGLSKVIVLENRLEMCLNGEASKPQLSNEVKNWPLIFQNNARFLACDIKVISSSVRRGSPQVVSAVETSLDSLEKLTESCEKTCSMLNEKSNQNGRSLVAMVKDVIKQYRDIISVVKVASGQQPHHSDVEVLVEKTNAMATLIASLIRELRNY